MKTTLLSPLLTQATPTLTLCLRIAKTNGSFLGFTTFNKTFDIDGVTYFGNDGFIPTDIEFTKEESYNMEIAGILSSRLTYSQLKLGGFSLAKVIVFLVDYSNLPLNLSDEPKNYLDLFSGFINKISFTEDTYTLEVLSNNDFLNSEINWSTSKNCRYEFCDQKCGLDYNNYREIIAVQSPGSSNDEFTSNVSGFDDKYTGSILTWTTGNNTGESSMVIKFNGQDFYTLDAFSNPIQTGDEFEVYRQCDKTQSNCQYEYGNFDNFGGEPSLPGLDEYYSGEPQ